MGSVFFVLSPGVTDRALCALISYEAMGTLHIADGGSSSSKRTTDRKIEQHRFTLSQVVRQQLMIVYRTRDVHNDAS